MKALIVGLIKSLIVGLCVLMTGCASTFGEKWSKADTSREVVWEGLHVMDWGQTRYIAKHPDKYRELNPILGSHPSQNRVDIYMGSGLLLHPVISAYLSPQEYAILGIKVRPRSLWQYFTITLSGGCVINNASIGVRVGW